MTAGAAAGVTAGTALEPFAVSGTDFTAFVAVFFATTFFATFLAGAADFFAGPVFTGVAAAASADPVLAVVSLTSAARSARSRSRIRLVSSSTSSWVARPTNPSARSTSYRTRLTSDSRLARPVASRSSVSACTCSTVAPPDLASFFAAALAFFFETSESPVAIAR